MRLALNFLTIDPDRSLSGIGNYCVKLLDNMLALTVEHGLDIQFQPYVQQGADRHFDDRLKPLLTIVPRVTSRLQRVLFEQTRFARLLRAQKTDLLLNPAFTGPLHGARRNATVVHDLYFRTVPELLDPWQRRYLRLMVPLNCRLSARIFTDSRNGALDLARYYPSLKKRVAAVPLAGRFDTAPANHVRPDRLPRKPYVLTVANLTGNKNIGAAISAVSKLRVAGNDIEFVHVGSDAQRLLERAVVSHNAGSWLTHLQDVDDETLIATYQNAECVAIPSIYEGFGLPLLEAQQLGVPVVAANTSCLPEVGGDGALYADPLNHDELAAQLDRLLKSPDLRTDLVDRGRRNASSYSWRRTALETMQHLNLIPA